MLFDGCDNTTLCQWCLICILFYCSLILLQREGSSSKESFLVMLHLCCQWLLSCLDLLCTLLLVCSWHYDFHFLYTVVLATTNIKGLPVREAFEHCIANEHYNIPPIQRTCVYGTCQRGIWIHALPININIYMMWPLCNSWSRYACMHQSLSVMLLIRWLS